MSKLALSDEILLTVDKPARYIGNEVNSVKKNPKDVAVRFAFAFPDVYEVGMSHLGIQILYDRFNRRDDVYCERVYSPWTDLDVIMREKQIPLFALESQDPVRDFDFLGITIQYEMCYTNILQVLDLSQIPIWAKDRTEEHPIVIGGGPCSYNPEPIADFFDIFNMGEGEMAYDALFDLYKEEKEKGFDRQRFLRKAAKLDGMYVPSLYHVEYKEDGTIKEMKPLYEDVPQKVKRLVVSDMTDTSVATYPEKPVVPYIKVTQDRVVLEIMRGCIRGCRFCQAGMIYRPNRYRNLEMLKEYATKMLKNTGHGEISLSSLSSSDYPELKELTYFLIEEFGKQGVNISLPSLRIDEFSLDVMSKVQDIKKSSLTFAPEAGSQRMRDVINKGLTEEDILNGAMEAFKGGWNKVKLYFMLGLPGETKEDQKGIAYLSQKIAEEYYTIPKHERNGRVQITASASFFVPKPFTPFQWAPMKQPKDYMDSAHLVNDTFREQVNRKSLSFKWHDAKTTVLEGVFARGDRKLSKAIYEAYKSGCIYDAWTEYFDYDKWLAAFDKTGIDVDFYTIRERDLDEVFPWDFIDIGVTKEFMKREWKNAMEAKVTPNCKMKCSGCGAARYNGGICYEN
jgi:radical SAM family uncharacterized protein